MKRFVKILIFLIVAAGLVAGAKKLIHTRRLEMARMKPPAERPEAVETAVIRKGEMPLSRHFLGVIEPVRVADIAFRARGYLETLPKDVGDRVRKGESIARIKDPLVVKKSDSAAAALKGARDESALRKKELERRQTLFDKGHLSEDKLDEAKRMYRIAKARVEQLRAESESALVSRNFIHISAPFSGVISERFVDAGDLVKEGQPVYRLESPSHGYKILVDIPHKFRRYVQPGDRVILTNENRQIKTEITRIHPAVHKGNLSTAEARVESAPFGLPSGSVAGVDIQYTRISGLVVPLASILDDGDHARVFRVNEKSRAEKHRVEVLGRSNGNAVVSGPLRHGDVVVKARESMLLGLSDGEPVYIGNERKE